MKRSESSLLIEMLELLNNWAGGGGHRVVVDGITLCVSSNDRCAQPVISAPLMSSEKEVIGIHGFGGGHTVQKTEKGAPGKDLSCWS